MLRLVPRIASASVLVVTGDIHTFGQARERRPRHDLRLATILIAIIAFGIFGYIGIFPFIVGIATPFVAGWLYRAGSAAS